MVSSSPPCPVRALGSSPTLTALGQMVTDMHDTSCDELLNGDQSHSQACAVFQCSADRSATASVDTRLLSLASTVAPAVVTRRPKRRRANEKVRKKEARKRQTAKRKAAAAPANPGMYSPLAVRNACSVRRRCWQCWRQTTVPGARPRSASAQKETSLRWRDTPCLSLDARPSG